MPTVTAGQSVVIKLGGAEAIWVNSTGVGVAEFECGSPQRLNLTSEYQRIGFFGADSCIELRSVSGQINYQSSPPVIYPLTAVAMGDRQNSSPVDIALTVNQALYTAAPPAELSLLPLALANLQASKQGDSVSCNIKPEDLFDVSAITNTYYVNVARPDNAGNGLTWATAKKSIRSAIDTANASGLPSRIAVRSGVYSRTNGFNTTGTGVTTAVPLYIYSVFGRVKTGNFDELTYTKTGGQNYVWQVARSLVNNVLNPQINAEYTYVASIAACDALPGSFFTDNVTLYVHAHSSGVVTSQNCLPNLNANGTIFIGNQNVMLSGFDFVGGSAGAVSFSGGSTNVCIMQDCTASYALGGIYSARTAQNGVVVLGCGIFAAFNSGASLNSNDGFNIHKDGADVRPFSLLVNCYGFNNGTLPSSVSNNGYTVHDGCHSIDIGGTWTGSVGTNSGHINDGTVVWQFGSKAGASDGDVINGGTVTWGAFGAWAGNCTLYLDSCTDFAANIGVYAAGGGTVYLRNHSGTGSLFGNALTY
jgi:hypothetical protein